MERRIEGQEANQSIMNGRCRRKAGLIAGLFFIVLLAPISSSAEEVESCCEDPQEFELFLVGESDNGELSPFESSLDEEESVEVTSSIFGEVEVGTWEIQWGSSGSYSEGDWIFRIPYEVVDSSGLSANASVLVRVGGNSYQSSAQLPGFLLSGSGELEVPINVGSGSISNDDKIEVTFWLRSVIFSNPGSESGVRFMWGSQQNDASLTLSFPLVEVEMRDASVKGDLVFIPVRLTSGFGDKMWTSSVGGMSVQNQEIIESPITTSIDGGAEVTFVWQMPDGYNGGSLRTDFFLNPQSSIKIETDKSHEIVAGQDTGDNSWYPEEEPPRTGGSNLAIIADCKYEGSTMNRETTIIFNGAMSQWTRWGLDNIGNRSLGSSSWWKNLNSYSDSISSSDKQNGRVDDSEETALRSHLTGSKSDLKSFLSNGLMIEPESVFGINPVLFGPIDISIDFGSSRAFNSDKISITIVSSYEIDGSRQKLIEDFIRPGGFDYWSKVELSFEVKTGMLSGFGGIYSETQDVTFSHRRWVVMEIIQIDEPDIDSKMEFRIEFESDNALLYSPLVSAMVSVFALCVAIGIGMGLTKKRARAPSMILVGVLGILTFSIYWYGLPMQIVLGAVSASVLLVFPAAMISPPNKGEDGSDENKVFGRVRCPSCRKKIPIKSEVRPLRMDCSGCGSTLRLE